MTTGDDAPTGVHPPTGTQPPAVASQPQPHTKQDVEEPKAALFGDWILGGCGCEYARQVRTKLVRVLALDAAFDDDAAAWLESHCEAAAAWGRVAAVCFPDLEPTDGIVQFLECLMRREERWRILALSTPPHLAQPGLDTVDFQVFWKRADGDECSVLGAAPYVVLPPTRRAPFLGVALWPGQRLTEPNPGFRKTKAGTPAGLIDIPLTKPRGKTRAEWTTSMTAQRDRMDDRTTAIYDVEFKERKPLHAMTFRLLASDCTPTLASIVGDSATRSLIPSAPSPAPAPRSARPLP